MNQKKFAKKLKNKPFSKIDLEAVQVHAASGKGEISYRFTLPLFEGTDAIDLVRLLLGGANIKMTFEDGSKKQIVLRDV